jgi:hypothetical protein
MARPQTLATAAEKSFRAANKARRARGVVARQALRFAIRGDEFAAYELVLIYSLRIADETSLSLPVGKRRLVRALTRLGEELQAVRELL